MLTVMSDTIAQLNTALEGRYTIERELGAGNSATVYLARDLKHDRQVAVKVLIPELAAAVGPERFHREIKTTANLTHPHILPLFDSGDADGFLFYVMPYLKDGTLRDRVDRETQLPVEEAVRIATSVASALEHAHEHDVIHRDIKPANILLQDGQPVVADFGIALALGIAGDKRLTETDGNVGTPSYMSPEQASGEREVDRRTDVYSLACVAYEMLAGEPPYAGQTWQAVLANLMTEPVPRVGTLRKKVPKSVEWAITKAMAKEPEHRFATVSSFAEALTGARAHSEPIPRPRPWMRFRRSVLAAGGVILLVGVGMAIRGRGPASTGIGSQPVVPLADTEPDELVVWIPLSDTEFFGDGVEVPTIQDQRLFFSNLSAFLEQRGERIWSGVSVVDIEDKTRQNPEFARRVLGQRMIFRELSEFAEERGLEGRILVRFFDWEELLDVLDYLPETPEESLPHVFGVPSSWTARLADRGALAPLEDIDTGLYLPSALETAKARAAWPWPFRPFRRALLTFRDNPESRQLYALPWAVDVRLLFYWKDALGNGPFDHRDEFEAALSRAEERASIDPDGIFTPPLAIPSAADWELLHSLSLLIWGEGGDWLESWRNFVPRSASSDALEFLLRLRARGMATFPRITRIEVEDQFLEGRVSSMLAGPWMFRRLEDRLGEDWLTRVGVQIPPLNVLDEEQVTYLGGVHLGLTPSGMRHPSAPDRARALATIAWALAAFLLPLSIWALVLRLHTRLEHREEDLGQEIAEDEVRLDDHQEDIERLEQLEREGSNDAGGTAETLGEIKAGTTWAIGQIEERLKELRDTQYEIRDALDTWKSGAALKVLWGKWSAKKHDPDVPGLEIVLGSLTQDGWEDGSVKTGSKQTKLKAQAGELAEYLIRESLRRDGRVAPFSTIHAHLLFGVRDTAGSMQQLASKVRALLLRGDFDAVTRGNDGLYELVLDERDTCWIPDASGAAGGPTDYLEAVIRPYAEALRLREQAEKKSGGRADLLAKGFEKASGAFDAQVALRERDVHICLLLAQLSREAPRSATDQRVPIVTRAVAELRQHQDRYQKLDLPHIQESILNTLKPSPPSRPFKDRLPPPLRVQWQNLENLRVEIRKALPDDLDSAGEHVGPASPGLRDLWYSVQRYVRESQVTADELWDDRSEGHEHAEFRDLLVGLLESEKEAIRESQIPQHKVLPEAGRILLRILRDEAKSGLDPTITEALQRAVEGLGLRATWDE